ncbi:serine/arginine-rich splicing factor RSZ21A-like isoform X3 [Asterias rubens]|uniref:serine/arginine-rich splicing factor RSZ21A-like isoform X3 n=1 Tax=Asterias rubens TaxID=7604 RepID=UPI001455B17C|nr:serine/arginine-rich splicing factor RSZ21A-like isoform X3 [Asterias rubens]
MGRYSSDDDNNSDDERERTRIYIGDINSETTRTDLERIFKKFGSLFEVWLARYPPLFAFVAFKKRRDAEDAVREMNGETINGSRVQVNIARPRNRGRTSFGRSSFHDPEIRCYHCQERGHIARHCTKFTSGYRRHFSRSRSRSPGPGGRNKGRRSNSRERMNPRRRTPSRSRSRSREHRRNRSEQGTSR